MSGGGKPSGSGSGSGAAEAARALLGGGKGSKPVPMGGGKKPAETPQNTPVTPSSGFKEFEKKKGFSSAPVPLGAAGGQWGRDTKGSSAADSTQDDLSTPQNTPLDPSPLAAGLPSAAAITAALSNGDKAQVQKGASVDGSELAARLSGLSVTDESGKPVVTTQADIEALIESMQAQNTASRIAELPAPVRPRVWALKHIQAQRSAIDLDYRKALAELQVEFEKRFAPLYERRAAIVKGDAEPTPEESAPPDSQASDAADKSSDSEKTSDAQADDSGPTIVGIPGFWVKAMQACPETGAEIEEEDVPALEALQDISARTIVPSDESPAGFEITFTFGPNEYFSNSVLTKTYLLGVEDNGGDLVLESAKGTEINWKQGKNLTVSTVTKKQRHKGKGTVRTVTKEEPADSFFSFFSPPDINTDVPDEEADDLEELLYMDFEIGSAIKDKLIPRAVLYYTGEADEVESDEEDDDEDEDDEDDDSDEDDSDEEEGAKSRGRGGRRGGRGRGGGGRGRGGGPGGGAGRGIVPEGGKPADCKQQ